MYTNTLDGGDRNAGADVGQRGSSAFDAGNPDIRKDADACASHATPTLDVEEGEAN